RLIDLCKQTLLGKNQLTSLNIYNRCEAKIMIIVSHRHISLTGWQPCIQRMPEKLSRLVCLKQNDKKAQT
ncbi:unnamed protein product, partial [Adineta ricciae]